MYHPSTNSSHTVLPHRAAASPRRVLRLPGHRHLAALSRPQHGRNVHGQGPTGWLRCSRPRAADGRRRSGADALRVLRHQQRHQLRHVALAAAVVRSVRLDGAADVLSTRERRPAGRLSGSAASECDAVPVAGATRECARATRGGMCCRYIRICDVFENPNINPFAGLLRPTGPVVSPAVRLVSRCHARRWRRRVRRHSVHHLELHAPVVVRLGRPQSATRPAECGRLPEAAAAAPPENTVGVQRPDAAQHDDGGQHLHGQRAEHGRQYAGRAPQQ